MPSNAGNSALDYSTVPWHKFVKYDVNSPTYLTYIVDSGCRNPKYKKCAGEPAGNLRNHLGKKMSPQVVYKGKTYCISRVIWFMLKGELPDHIEHLDGDVFNNNVENLIERQLVSHDPSPKARSSNIVKITPKFKDKDYVYLHKTLDGKVFYVGKGRNNRCNHSSGRSKTWKLFAEKGYTVDIVDYFDTNELALSFESKLISQHASNGILTNKNKSSSRFDYNFEQLNNFFYYDETSPSGLRYRQATRIKPVGAIAGSKDHYGYWNVYFRGYTCKVHRIVWVLTHGDINKELYINHIDCNPSNNLLNNLEIVTPAENSQRTVKQKNPLVGIKLVNVYAHGRYVEYWVCTYKTKSGEAAYKRFKVSKYGYEVAKEMAIEYKNQMEIKE
jgi:hypothetical protein